DHAVLPHRRAGREVGQGPEGQARRLLGAGTFRVAARAARRVRHARPRAGAEPERIAGVGAGAIGGTVVGPEFKTKIEELHLNILADLRTIKIPWEQDALETSRKFLETKRDVLERVMKSLLMGNAYVLNPANKAAVIELLRTKLGLKTPQEGESAYSDLTKFYVLKKPYPYKDGLKSIITEVGKVVPKAASLKPEDVIDTSLIEKLDKSGFIDGLYK